MATVEEILIKIEEEMDKSKIAGGWFDSEKRHTTSDLHRFGRMELASLKNWIKTSDYKPENESWR